MKYTLVLMRHGESTANLAGTYAGWADVPLTEAGIAQACDAGGMLRDAGFDFDACYTSVLDRAIRSLWHCLDTMDRTWLPVVHSWRLNERHYGALQGLDKSETEALFGAEQVRQWRRGFHTRPPAAGEEERRRIRQDARYADLDPADIPCGESMHDSVLRLQPLWRHEIAPRVADGQRILVVAHGTTLRAFVKLLSGLPDEEVEQVEIPNGIPLVYTLDRGMRASGLRACGSAV